MTAEYGLALPFLARIVSDGCTQYVLERPSICSQPSIPTKSDKQQRTTHAHVMMSAEYYYHYLARCRERFVAVLQLAGVQASGYGSVSHILMSPFLLDPYSIGAQTWRHHRLRAGGHDAIRGRSGTFRWFAEVRRRGERRSGVRRLTASVCDWFFADEVCD